MEKQRWDQRRERVRRKKMQAREKVAKPRNTVFFQWFVAPEGRKVGSPKWRVWSHVARWEMKNCTPLWREAQVKMYKTPHVWTAFGSWDVEKVHAVVVRSTFPSQNVQSTPGSGHFWKLWRRKSARRCGAKPKSKCPKHTRVGALLEVEMSKKCTPLWREAHVEVKMSQEHTHVWNDFWKLWCRKSARRCGAKHMWKSKCTKHRMFGRLLEVEMSKKCTLLWREAHFEVKSVKIWRVRSTFGRSDVVLRGRRKGLCTWSKMSKTWGFLAFPKTMAGVGRLKRIWKDAFSVAGAVQETCSSEMLGGQGADFLRGVAFWSIRFSGRWFCVTGATLCMTWHHFVVAGAILQRHGLEKCKTHWYEAVSSAFNFPLLKEVSQNCFVFDVANFGGSLAE